MAIIDDIKKNLERGEEAVEELFEGGAGKAENSLKKISKKGGESTLKKYGREHFARMGRKGGKISRKSSKTSASH